MGLVVNDNNPPSGQQLLEALWLTLRADGKDPEALHVDDLVAVDHFHVRGKQATVELADLLQQQALPPQPRILDIGAGLGGSARYLANRFAATLVGLELSAAYVEVAQTINERLGLQQQIHFCQGSGIAIPYAPESFDVVWLQHVSMYIADKERLFAEIFRVLKPGGRLILQEIVAGNAGEAYFPVPWASDAAHSYLATPDGLMALFQQSGFEPVEVRDLSEAALHWFERQSQRRVQTKPASLSLQLLLGISFGAMMRNQLRNFQEQRIGLIQVLVQRP